MAATFAPNGRKVTRGKENTCLMILITTGVGSLLDDSWDFAQVVTEFLI
jgi:hypothetical protein